MAPPLAGRPPFATDEPDSIYQTTPQPRLRPQQQGNQSSAHNAYDNHLAPGEGGGNRNSGVGAVGMGFMNGNMDDDSDDEEGPTMRGPSAPSTPSRTAALAAAVGVSPAKGPERFETPPPQYNNPGNMRSPSPKKQPQMPSPQARSPPAIAAPRPGYANAVPALSQTLTRPSPAAVSAPPSRVEGLRIVPPSPGSGVPLFVAPPSPYGSPSPSSTPHPLEAPVTPITPIFARPQRTATQSSDASGVTFDDSKNLIMRGDKEETLLARARPGARAGHGDQFWRRFSMVAKDPKEKRPSDWLSQSQGDTSRQRSWIWIVGVILLICAAGGIGIGMYVSHKSAGNYRPTAIGGSANEVDNGTTTAAAPAATGVGGAIATKSGLHVTPTNTVARRAKRGHSTRLALDVNL